MRSQHIPMTWEEYERHEWRFGWKHEYWDGQAHFTPRHNLVFMRVPAEPHGAILTPEGLSLREPCVADEPAMVEAFLDAFADGVEYCDWQREKIEEAAQKNIRDYFAGKRGMPHRASRLAVAIDEASESVTTLAGVALLVTRSDGSVLDLLLVRPHWQRHGLATALVSTAMNELHRAGERSLRSAHHIANEASAAWHRSFGFVEEPDLSVAHLRRKHFWHELWRAEKLRGESGYDESALSRLRAEYEHWKKQMETLEAISERDGYEAVMPVLRYD